MEFLYHAVTHGDVLISNLPGDLFEEMNKSTAKTRYAFCPVRRIYKRHKKVQLDDGYVYFCSYDQELTNNQFSLCLEAFISMIDGVEDSIKRAARPSFDAVKSLRHNVYDQLSHIQDDLKTLISFEDIPSKDWPGIVDHAANSILSKAETTSRAILRTIQRTAIALAEFDAYELINSSNKPNIFPQKIHKVVKLTIQPYIYDLWDRGVKVQIGECYDKVNLDYDLTNLAFGHFWNNAVKYVKPGTEIAISFSPAASYKGINVTISMVSLFINKKEIDAIFEKGVSGAEANRTRLCGHGMGMYYIRECMKKCFGEFSVNPGENKHMSHGKEYASNSFKFFFTT